MAVRNIIIEPDPRYGEVSDKLRHVSEPVTVFDEELAELAADLHETMCAAPGIGLAAPQVGIYKRLIAVRLPEGYQGEESPEEIHTLVNPEIVKAGGNDRNVEGCLSFPDLLGMVDRYTWTTIKAQHLDGSTFRFKARDVLARVLQHEIDHLNGYLFFDRMEDISDLFYLEDLEDYDEDHVVDEEHVEAAKA